MKKLGLQLLKIGLPMISLSLSNLATAQSGPIMFATDERQLAYKTTDSYLNEPSTSNRLTELTNAELTANKRLELKTILTNDNILFEYRKFDLTNTATQILDKVVIFMFNNPTSVFEINGYADARGDYEDNLVLAKKRAHAVEHYLVSKGIEESRVDHYSYGEEDLINVCDSDSHCGESHHATNRRVEIILVSVE